MAGDNLIRHQFLLELVNSYEVHGRNMAESIPLWVINSIPLLKPDEPKWNSALGFLRAHGYWEFVKGDNTQIRITQRGVDAVESDHFMYLHEEELKKEADEARKEAREIQNLTFNGLIAAATIITLIVTQVDQCNKGNNLLYREDLLKRIENNTNNSRVKEADTTFTIYKRRDSVK